MPARPLALAALSLLTINLALAAPTPVEVRSLAEVLIAKKYTAPATAVAINSSRISAELTARITRIHARTGDIVDVGDALVSLDCRRYENALKRATAQRDSLSARLQLAERQRSRAQSLRRKNNLAAEILDRRNTDLAIARADLRAQRTSIADAGLSLEHCSITAPYRAAITSRLVGEGSIASPGLPLLTIAGLDAVELSAQVPLHLTASLAASTSLTFVGDTARLPVSIRNTSPIINAASGSREVRLSAGRILAPGSSGRLEWWSPPLLPAALLSRREGALGVLIARASGAHTIAHFIPLDGALEGRPMAIALPADTRVIVEGRHKLAAGDTIRITAPEAP